MEDLYRQLVQELTRSIPAERIIQDPLRTLAYGTDASFYRLIPKLVVRVASEAEVATAMRACGQLRIPYTFRAAGTSLSGQALSDSVLIQLSTHWNKISVGPDGLSARFEPAVLGGAANAALAPFQRRIGPDPASLDAAMLGGIVANNSSGMCCGNVQDTYHTLASLRAVLADGCILDTGSEPSRREFAVTHHHLLEGLDRIARQVKDSHSLTDRIRKKYRIKNTTGYSLNALVDFTDPFQILEHLLVGSEGTLAFISEIAYNTVPDPPFHATGMLLFDGIRAACEACFLLSRHGLDAAELMDRQSLRSVEDQPGIPDYFRSLGPEAAALLVEVQSSSPDELRKAIEVVGETLVGTPLLYPASFVFDKAESKQLWNVRKGLFPSLGKSRAAGTTIIIEDVAVPIANLAEACLNLRELLDQHGYSEGVIFGHALQGNMHFVFCPDFNRGEEVRRYELFIDDLAKLIVGKYDGSLKAEHGTGRNMAPFVEQEWGSEAFALMREIKMIFDPDNLLNPGVIINSDPRAHVKDLKKTSGSNRVIEKCTECGFCERTCPSRNLTLTPRQRIVAWREISRLTATGEDAGRLKSLRASFEYQGDQTCAADGLCATLCPVGIDTGDFIKQFRSQNHSPVSNSVARYAARHMDWVTAGARSALRLSNAGQRILGNGIMKGLTDGLRSLSGGRTPAWNSWIPRPSRRSTERWTADGLKKVVYFPSCVSRTFGTSIPGPCEESQNVVFERLLRKAGYEAVYPEKLDALCCGMAFSSKGYKREADAKAKELSVALNRASCGGELPIVFDTSPCAHSMRLNADVSKRSVYDVTEFILEELAPALTFEKLNTTVAVHIPCSIRKMHLENRLIELAKRCADHVYVPDAVPCCGFAGDRGFSHPELPASALVSLKGAMPPECAAGYSTSRTCELGVSIHSGLSYQSIVYLVDRVVETVSSR